MWSYIRYSLKGERMRRRIAESEATASVGNGNSRVKRSRIKSSTVCINGFEEQIKSNQMFGFLCIEGFKEE